MRLQFQAIAFMLLIGAAACEDVEMNNTVTDPTLRQMQQGVNGETGITIESDPEVVKEFLLQYPLGFSVSFAQQVDGMACVAFKSDSVLWQDGTGIYTGTYSIDPDNGLVSVSVSRPTPLSFKMYLYHTQYYSMFAAQHETVTGVYRIQQIEQFKKSAKVLPYSVWGTPPYYPYAVPQYEFYPSGAMVMKPVGALEQESKWMYGHYTLNPSLPHVINIAYDNGTRVFAVQYPSSYQIGLLVYNTTDGDYIGPHGSTFIRYTQIEQ